MLNDHRRSQHQDAHHQPEPLRHAGGSQPRCQVRGSQAVGRQPYSRRRQRLGAVSRRDHHDAFQIRGDFGNARHSNDDVHANKLIQASADAEFPDIIENQPNNNDNPENAADDKPRRKENINYTSTGGTRKVVKEDKDECNPQCGNCRGV
jgi:hypothetical protein